jgi:hypothetical protein
VLLLELTVADMTCQLYVKDPPTPKTRRKYTLQRCWILIWGKMKRDVIFFLSSTHRTETIFNFFWPNFVIFYIILIIQRNMCKFGNINLLFQLYQPIIPSVTL